MAGGVLQGRAPCNPATLPHQRATPPQHPTLSTLQPLSLKDSSPQSHPTTHLQPQGDCSPAVPPVCTHASPSEASGMYHTRGFPSKGFPGTALQAHIYSVPSQFLCPGVYNSSRAAQQENRTEQSSTCPSTPPWNLACSRKITRSYLLPGKWLIQTLSVHSYGLVFRFAFNPLSITPIFFCRDIKSFSTQYPNPAFTHERTWWLLRFLRLYYLVR